MVAFNNILFNTMYTKALWNSDWLVPEWREVSSGDCETWPCCHHGCHPSMKKTKTCCALRWDDSWHTWPGVGTCMFMKRVHSLSLEYRKCVTLHEQQFGTLQWLASHVSEEVYACPTLPDSQVSFDRGELACGLKMTKPTWGENE